MNLHWDLFLLPLIILAFVAFIFCLVWILVRRTAKFKGEPAIPLVDIRTQSVFGHNIRYVQEGTGPHLILIHGIGASVFVWRRLIPLLSKHYTVTAFDLLGFGLSDKPLTFKYDLDSQCEAIEEFLNQLKIPQCFLAGSSMGGAIALRLAQVNPNRYQKVVTLSPLADPKIAFLDLKRFGFLSPIVQPLLTERFIEQVLKRVLSNRELINKESLQHYTQPYKQREALIAFTKSFSLLRDKRIYTELSNVQQPVLVLWGEKDKIIPIKYSQRITLQLKNMIFYSHPQSGHHPHEDEPQWTSEKITQFLSDS